MIWWLMSTCCGKGCRTLGHKPPHLICIWWMRGGHDYTRDSGESARVCVSHDTSCLRLWVIPLDSKENPIPPEPWEYRPGLGAVRDCFACHQMPSCSLRHAHHQPTSRNRMRERERLACLILLHASWVGDARKAWKCESKKCKCDMFYHVSYHDISKEYIYAAEVRWKYIRSIFMQLMCSRNVFAATLDLRANSLHAKLSNWLCTFCWQRKLLNHERREWNSFVLSVLHWVFAMSSGITPLRLDFTMAFRENWHPHAQPGLAFVQGLHSQSFTHGRISAP